MIILRSKAQLDSFKERNPFRMEHTPGHSWQECSCCHNDYMQYEMESGEYGVYIDVVPIRRGVSRVIEVYEEEYWTYNQYGEVQDRLFRIVKTKTVAIYRPRK